VLTDHAAISGSVPSRLARAWHIGQTVTNTRRGG